MPFPIGLVLSINIWVRPVDVQWLWFFVIGVAVLLAHYCMAKAMQYAEVARIVTIELLRLPLISLIGILLYAEKFEASLMIGEALMLMGNLVNIKAMKTPVSNKVINRVS